MIDYLIRTKVILPSGVRPSGRGKKRMFTFSDLVFLKVLKKILDRGVSVQRLKVALANLEPRHRNFDISQLPAKKFLVTDGHDIFHYDDIELLNLSRSGQFEFFFMVDMHRVHSEVKTSVPPSLQYKGKKARA